MAGGCLCLSTKDSIFTDPTISIGTLVTICEQTKPRFPLLVNRKLGQATKQIVVFLVGAVGAEELLSRMFPAQTRFYWDITAHEGDMKAAFLSICRTLNSSTSFLRRRSNSSRSNSISSNNSHLRTERGRGRNRVRIREKLASAFISHAVRDEAELMGVVEQCRGLYKPNLFLCADGIPTGTGWQLKIIQALRDQEIFVLFLSKHSRLSHFCSFEVISNTDTDC